MNIVSIDIGIISLGLVACELEPSYRIKKATYCKLVNLTKECTTTNCKLYHTNTITDRMMHFFQEHSDLLNNAYVILIERQIPTSGLCAIQELIFYTFRNKAILISPSSMHAHFSIGWLDYEKRKKATIDLASSFLNFHEEFVFNEKKDDLADAWCYIKFWSDVKAKEYHIEKIKEEWLKNQSFESLDQFRYTPEIDAITMELENTKIQ